MEKRYKNSLVLGKFYPFHLGHAYLIDTAIEHSETVYVLICSLISEQIPGKLRYQWIREHYSKNPNVKVIHVAKELPQYPEEDPENFWQLWRDVVYSNVEKLDCIFASEDYVKPFADVLGISSYMVDRGRINVPISGTAIRENPIKNWNFIPDVAKSYFTKRVAIMGPESCGKSTLSKMLAKHYNIEYVEEYGRLVYEFRNGELNEEAFIHITEGRQVLENFKLKSGNKLLICDTEDLTTYLFSRMFLPETYKTIEKELLNKFNESKKYDLYILLAPDCDSIQDGTRKFLNFRWTHFHKIQMLLEKYSLPYKVVTGNWNDRFKRSVEIIDSKFKCL